MIFSRHKPKQRQSKEKPKIAHLLWRYRASEQTDRETCQHCENGFAKLSTSGYENSNIQQTGVQFIFRLAGEMVNNYLRGKGQLQTPFIFKLANQRTWKAVFTCQRSIESMGEFSSVYLKQKRQSYDAYNTASKLSNQIEVA